MKDLIKLRSMLCEELSEFGRMDGLSAGNLEIVDKLTHSIKNLDKVIESESGYSGNGYSMNAGYPMSYGSESYGRMAPYSYDDRGRGTYADRDSMGRYSNRGGYSRGDMMSEMRGLVDRADGRSRQGYERFMGQMENM